MSIKSLLALSAGQAGSLCQREVLPLFSKEGRGAIFRFDCPVPGITSHRTRGFTLLEVVVSLAIVSGLLVTVISSLNYHLGIAERHEFTTVATMLALDKLREAEKQQVAAKGSFPEPLASYTYSTETKNTDYPGIILLTVIVSRGGDTVRFSEMMEKRRL